MRTPATIAGHPIHPMLIPIPLTLWIFSVFGDIMSRWGGRREWEQTSYRSLRAGVFAAPVVAVPGFIDWLSLENPQKQRTGALHMASNLGALSLFTASLWQREKDGDQFGAAFALSLAGLALLVAGGWLGGHLVYVDRVGVQEPERRAASLAPAQQPVYR